MPWDAKEAKRFTKKAPAPKAQRQWKDVANSVLKRGGSDASAVRQANAVIKRRKAREKRTKRMEEKDVPV